MADGMLSRWRDTTVPYRPGAKYTQGFGLRISDIGSPLHLGVDRGAYPREILMPFDGRYVWERHPDTVAGSVLHLIPNDEGGRIEIQVFHTVPVRDIGIDSMEDTAQRGDSLPLQAGDIGLSEGIHTHTELIVKYSNAVERELREPGVPILTDGDDINDTFVRAHCKRHELDFDTRMEAIKKQIRSWGILRMTMRYAVRDGLPEYRRQPWQPGRTIHIDTKWALNI